MPNAYPINNPCSPIFPHVEGGGEGGRYNERGWAAITVYSQHLHNNCWGGAEPTSLSFSDIHFLHPQNIFFAVVFTFSYSIMFSFTQFSFLLLLFPAYISSVKNFLFLFRSSFFLSIISFLTFYLLTFSCVTPLSAILSFLLFNTVLFLLFHFSSDISPTIPSLLLCLFISPLPFSFID